MLGAITLQVVAPAPSRTPEEQKEAHGDVMGCRVLHLCSDFTFNACLSLSKPHAAIDVNVPGCRHPGRRGRGGEPRLLEAMGFLRIWSRSVRWTKPSLKPSTRQPKPSPQKPQPKALVPKPGAFRQRCSIYAKLSSAPSPMKLRALSPPGPSLSCILPRIRPATDNILNFLESPRGPRGDSLAQLNRSRCQQPSPSDTCQYPLFRLFVFVYSCCRRHVVASAG